MAINGFGFKNLVNDSTEKTNAVRSIWQRRIDEAATFLDPRSNTSARVPMSTRINRTPGKVGEDLIGVRDDSSTADRFRAKQNFYQDYSGAANAHGLVDTEKLKPPEFRNYESMIKSMNDGTYNDAADLWQQRTKDYWRNKR